MPVRISEANSLKDFDIKKKPKMAERMIINGLIDDDGPILKEEPREVKSEVPLVVEGPVFVEKMVPIRPIPKPVKRKVVQLVSIESEAIPVDNQKDDVRVTDEKENVFIVNNTTSVSEKIEVVEKPQPIATMKRRRGRPKKNVAQSIEDISTLATESESPSVASTVELAEFIPMEVGEEIVVKQETPTIAEEVTLVKDVTEVPLVEEVLESSLLLEHCLTEEVVYMISKPDIIHKIDEKNVGEVEIEIVNPVELKDAPRISLPRLSLPPAPFKEGTPKGINTILIFLYHVD